MILRGAANQHPRNPKTAAAEPPRTPRTSETRETRKLDGPFHAGTVESVLKVPSSKRKYTELVSGDLSPGDELVEGLETK